MDSFPGIDETKKRKTLTKEAISFVFEIQIFFLSFFLLFARLDARIYIKNKSVT